MLLLVEQKAEYQQKIAAAEQQLAQSQQEIERGRSQLAQEKEQLDAYEALFA